MGSLPNLNLSDMTHEELVSFLEGSDPRVLTFVKEGELLGKDFSGLTAEELTVFQVPFANKIAILRAVQQFKNAIVIPLSSDKPTSTCTQRCSPQQSPVRIAVAVAPSVTRDLTPRRSPRVAASIKRSLVAHMEPPAPAKKRAVEQIQTFPQFSAQIPCKGSYAYARIDVKKTINLKGKDYKNGLRSGLISVTDRKAVCVILLTELCTLIQTWYPHGEARLHLAQDIVAAWPKLAAVVGKPESAFSCPAGHITMALRALRKTHKVTLRNVSASSSSKEKPLEAMSKPPSPSTSNSLTEEDLFDVESQVQIVNLACMEETVEKRGLIIQEMEKFSDLRRKMVKSGFTANSVVKHFPKMLSLEGALIETDFSSMMGNCDANFCGTFKVLYTQRILRCCESTIPQFYEQLLSFENDDLKALLALVRLVPKFPKQTSGAKGKSASNPAKGKGSLRGGINVLPPNFVVDKNCVPHPALMQVVQKNVDVQAYESMFWRTTMLAPKIVQPYLVFSSDDKSTGDFYLKANDMTVHLGPKCLRAFLILMKYHHIFDVEYDTDLIHFYKFLEYLCGVPGSIPTTKMNEFLVRLRNTSC